MTLRAYLVDDEPLALKRLSRLLKATGGVEIVGSSTNPGEALKALPAERVDVLFLDIQMPGMNGFELLAKLDSQPMVIFTTAHDRYALQAFEVNSIDYLLKPIEPPQLDRALRKLAQLRDMAGSLTAHAEFQSLVSRLAREFAPPQREFTERICSRVGDRIVFVELEQVTHFFSKDRLTFAATGSKKYVIDYTISELEEKLDAKGFLRIHRATLLNLSLVGELYRWFGGRMRVRLKDKERTELTVARDKVKTLKERLGLH
ncbi:MAG TPA: response regulator [Pyrinomonadaceae bacterium]|nr:response regulator [Pyrinomonadaceae bacterium]